jgi:hypothetical protein
MMNKAAFSRIVLSYIKATTPCRPADFVVTFTVEQTVHHLLTGITRAKEIE